MFWKALFLVIPVGFDPRPSVTQGRYSLLVDFFFRVNFFIFIYTFSPFLYCFYLLFKNADLNRQTTRNLSRPTLRSMFSII